VDNSNLIIIKKLNKIVEFFIFLFDFFPPYQGEIKRGFADYFFKAIFSRFFLEKKRGKKIAS